MLQLRINSNQHAQWRIMGITEVYCWGKKLTTRLYAVAAINIQTSSVKVKHT